MGEQIITRWLSFSNSLPVEDKPKDDEPTATISLTMPHVMRFLCIDTVKGKLRVSALTDPNNREDTYWFSIYAKDAHVGARNPVYIGSSSIENILFHVFLHSRP